MIQDKQAAIRVPPATAARHPTSIAGYRCAATRGQAAGKNRSSFVTGTLATTASPVC